MSAISSQDFSNFKYDFNHSNKPLYVVETINGTRHRVKKINGQTLKGDANVKTVDGLTVPEKFVKTFYACKDIAELQRVLIGK